MVNLVRILLFNSILLLSILLSSSGCKTKSVLTENKKEKITLSKKGLNEKIASLDSLYVDGFFDHRVLLRLSSNGCYGRCPKFEIKVFQSGYILWKGIEFTNSIGSYEGKMLGKDLLELRSMIDLIIDKPIASQYPKETYKGMSELPSVRLYLNSRDKIKTTIMYHDIPSYLKDLQKYVFDRIEKVENFKKL